MPLLQCGHVYYWHSQVYLIFLSPVKATCKLLRKARVLLNWPTALFWLVVSPCQASPHKYTTVSNLQPVSKDIKMTHRNTKCHTLKNMVTTLFSIHVWKRYPGPVSGSVWPLTQLSPQEKPTLQSFTTTPTALCGRTGRESTASNCSGLRWSRTLWIESWPTDSA